MTARRWVAAAVAGVVLTVALTGVGASAAPAGPRAHARVVAAEPVAPGARVTVRVTHLVAGSPVTVTWGDGRSSRRASACGPRAARDGAPRCARTATATFDTPGAYAVRVLQRGRVIAARTVTVAASGADPEESGWRAAMLDRVNEVRARAGAGPLLLCAALSRAAQGHAADMAAQGYFSHDSADGRTAGDRIEAAGYDGRTWGENIAAGYRDVAAVMAGWVGSPGHYENLVRASFTHLGVGRADGGRYGTTWVQDFGAGGRC